MHYTKTLAIAVLAATAVSAFPSGTRALATSDVIASPADDLVQRDLLLDVTDDKKQYARQSLFSEIAESNVISRDLHVPSLISKYIKRTANEPEFIDDAVLEDILQRLPIMFETSHTVSSPTRSPLRSPLRIGTPRNS